MFRSILVPLDGSSFGEQALPLAMSIARRSGARLELMHVHELLDVYYAELEALSDTVEETVRTHERSYLDTTVKRLSEGGTLQVTSVLEDGHVATQVRQHACQSKADLVVMTTHARGTLRRFWLGSTADELVRELPMPILLIHPGDQPVDIKGDVALKHILIALDGTPLAEQVLEPAGNLARLFGADVTLLRVVRPVYPASAPVGMGTFSEVALQMADDIDKLQKHLEEEAAAYVLKVAQRLRDDKLNVSARIVLEDQPGVGVLQGAQAAGADLIALETHGRRGLTRLFLGSVTDKVVRGAHVPILVHRPKH